MKVGRNIWIFGAGCHGMVVAETALENGFRLSGFLDDDEEKWGKAPFEDKLLELKVLGGKALVKPGDYVILGIGDNHKRRKIGEGLEEMGAHLFGVRNPKASISNSSTVGPGVVIIGHAVVNAAATIGKGTILNTNSTVDHECIIADFVHIAPGVNLAGNVAVGENSFIGIGAKVIPGITIGKDCIVGAGCVILKNVPDGEKVG